MNKIFEDHYDEIRNGSYEWKDWEVEYIYEYIYAFINEENVKIKGYTKEDLAQELALVFFRVITNYDTSRVHPLSTCLTRSFRVRCDTLRRGGVSVKAISLDNMDDVIDEKSLDYELELVKKEIVERFMEMNKNNKPVIEYFTTDVTLADLGREYGVTRERMRQYVEKAIKRARVDGKILRLYVNK